MTQLEEAQKQYTLDRMLKRLDKIDLPIVDELGYFSVFEGFALFDT